MMGKLHIIDIFSFFPPASRVLLDFRKPTAKRPTTGSTTACSCSTAMVRAGSPPGVSPAAAAGCPPAASSVGKPTRGRRAAAPAPLRSAHPCAGCPAAAGAAGSRATPGGSPGGPEPSGEPRRAAAGRPRSSHLCLVSGIRTEQDFYVRLIDSMTKQVGAAGRPRRRVGVCFRGGGVAAVGAAPGSAAGRPAEAKPAPAAKRLCPGGEGAAASPGGGVVCVFAGGYGRASRSAPAQRRGLRGRTAGTDPGVGAAGRCGGSPRDPARRRAWGLRKYRRPLQPS